MVGEIVRGLGSVKHLWKIKYQHYFKINYFFKGLFNFNSSRIFGLGSVTVFSTVGIIALAIIFGISNN